MAASSSQVQQTNFYATVNDDRYSSFTVAQIRALTKNNDLWDRFSSGCSRIYNNFGDMIQFRELDDYIVYIGELDLYGLCKHDNLIRLANSLRGSREIQEPQPTNLSIHEMMVRSTTLSLEERTQYAKDHGLELPPELPPPTIVPAPKSTLYQVILASEPCKLVFYCKDAARVATICEKIRAKWQKMTSVVSVDNEVEITVDSSHKNLEEAHKLYEEIASSFIPVRAMKGVLRTMELSRREPDAWMAVLDTMKSDIIAQLKTLRETPVVHNNVSITNSGTMQCTVGTHISAEPSFARDPKPIAEKWIIDNPPQSIERRDDYFKRYVMGNPNNHVDARKFPHLVGRVGYKAIHGTAGRFWRKSN